MEYLKSFIALLSDLVRINIKASYTNLNPIKSVPKKYIAPEKFRRYGKIDIHKSKIEYKNICSLAKSLPCVTGSIGTLAFL